MISKTYSWDQIDKIDRDSTFIEIYFKSGRRLFFSAKGELMTNEGFKSIDDIKKRNHVIMHDIC